MIHKKTMKSYCYEEYIVRDFLEILYHSRAQHSSFLLVYNKHKNFTLKNIYVKIFFHDYLSIPLFKNMGTLFLRKNESSMFYQKMDPEDHRTSLVQWSRNSHGYHVRWLFKLMPMCCTLLALMYWHTFEIQSFHDHVLTFVVKHEAFFGNNGCSFFQKR